MSRRCTFATLAALAFSGLAFGNAVRDVATGAIPFGEEESRFCIEPLPGRGRVEAFLAWRDEGLAVDVRSSGVFCGSYTLTVISGGDAKKVTGRIGEKVVFPWIEILADGKPLRGTANAVFDFTLDGISAADFESLGGKEFLAFSRASMSVLCAESGFRSNPHLANKEQWGEIVFGGKREEGTEKRGQGTGNGKNVELCKDFSELEAARGRAEIDGDLGEWKDAEFSEFALLPAALGSRYSGAVAARWDDEALYFAVRMSKPGGTPKNRAFVENRNGYAGGDAFQLRLADNNGRSESFCAWMDSSTGRPALTCDNKMLPADAVLAAGGALAFGKWSGGYTMELKLPWAAAGMKAPQANERRRATFQPWWGPAGGNVAVVTELSLARRPVKGLSLDLPREGRLAAGVFASDGSLVRQICAGRYLPKGAARFDWDGRDGRGGIVPPGRYELRGVLTDELKETYRFSLMNPGLPPWPTADGAGDWLSDEAPPQGVATDGERVFIASPGCEKGTTVLAIDKNDRRVWGFSTGSGFFPRCVSLSCADGKLYALFSGPVNSTGKKTPYNGKNAIGRAVVMCFDAATGKLAGFSARSPRVQLPDTWSYVERASGIWNLAKNKVFSPAVYIGQPRYFCADIGEPDNAIGLAALGDVLAVSKFFDNRIDFYDRETLEKRGSVEIEAPAGLCRIDDSAFLAVSGRSVVRVEVSRRDAENAELAEIVGNDLVAPVALTTDAAGNIYVSDWASEMCVKRFSAGGEFLGIVGKRGGRAWVGTFDENGMLLPHGLAVRGGSLYVAEADMLPKRVSKWDAKSGAYQRDWIGPRAYAGGDWLWLDPDDDSVVHVGGCSVRVDWETGAWKVVATDFRRGDDNEPFTQNGAGCMSSGMRVIKRGGKTFAALSQYRGKTVFYRREGVRFVPCAAIGSSSAATTRDGSGISVFDSDIGMHIYLGLNPAWMKGHPNSNWLWSDLNGDGLAQKDEVQFADAAAHRAGPKPGQPALWLSEWGCVPGKDGSLALAAHAKDETIIHPLRPRRWTEFGPVFDMAHVRELRREPRSAKDGIQGTYIDSADNIYCAGRYSGNRDPGGPYAVRSFAPDGSVRWTAETPKGRDAMSLSLSNFCAEWDVPGIGNVLGGWNWWWTLRPYLVTDDGLLLATAFEGGKDGPRGIWGESHQFFIERRGRRYVVNGGNQCAHFVELEGLDNALRIAEAFEFTADDAERAADVQEPEDVDPQVLAADRRRIRIPWQESVPVVLDGGNGRSARIALSRDADKLYVSADVDDNSPLVQNGVDWQTLFLSGDCVDVMLAGDDGKRRNPRETIPGDRRLLFSLFDGKGVAVLYEPVTEPRAKSPVQMMATSIDSVRIVESARVDFRRREDGAGYSLNASVPLADIGGLAERGDVGVVFSGAIGGRELRLYYYNRDTGMIDDLTTEATLQPHEWGRLVVAEGANLVNGAWRETRRTGAEEVETCADRSLRIAAKKGATRENPAHVSAEMPFDVKGGAEILPRFLCKAADMQIGTPQRKKAGLGYAEAHVSLVFYDAKGKNAGRAELAKITAPTVGWREVRGLWDGRPTKIVAPEGAVRGIVGVKFSCCEPSLAPELLIDGFEITESK